MQRILFFLIYTGFSLISFGQYWNPIKTQGYMLFEAPNSGNTIVGLRIDSVYAQGQDSVYRCFPTFNELDYYCINSIAGSWIGRMAIHTDSADWLFINRNEDPIILKTQFYLGYTWVMFHDDATDDFIEASITSIKDTVFLGIHDSIATLQLIKKNDSGVIVPSAINGMKLTLSRENGLLRFPNFFDFPEVQFSFNIQNPQFFSCVGISQPQAGIQNITMRDVFDLNINDEFHIYQQESYFFNNNHGYEEWDIFRVLDNVTSFDMDTFSYLIERCWYRDDVLLTGGNFTHTYTAGLDTVTVSWFANHADSVTFDKLPGEIVGESIRARYFMSSEHPSGRPAKMTPSGYEEVFWANDTCDLYQYYDGCSNSQTYYPGIPFGFYWCSWMMNSWSRVLIYYKIGSDTWGAPYDCATLGMNSIENDRLEATLFPNPSSGTINISLNTDEELLNLELYDAYSRFLYSRVVRFGTTSLDCSDLSDGIYFIRIKGDQHHRVLRFMVSH